MDYALKNFIKATEQYIGNQTNASVTSQLQKQIEVLIALTVDEEALKLDPTNIQMKECISCLITILSDSDTRGFIAHKILCLIQNFLHNPSLSSELRSTFHLTPILATFLCTHHDNENDPAIAQCLETLKILTYGLQIEFHEGYLDELLPYLINAIMVNPPHEFRLQCLIILANLCRRNVIIKKAIQNMDNKRQFYRCILHLIDGNEELGDRMLTIASLSTFASVGLNDDVGKKLFCSSNAHNTFELIFNLIHKEIEVQCFAVDLLVDMLQNKGIQKNLLRDKYFDACITKIFELPQTNSNPKSVAKIYELILALCSVDILSRVIIPLVLRSCQSGTSEWTPFKVAIHWYQQDLNTPWDAPIWAAKFLILLKDFCSCPGQGLNLGKQIDSLVPVIMEDLVKCSRISGPEFEKACEKSVASLTILENLCTHKNYSAKVATHLTVDICYQLLEGVLEHQNTADACSIREIMSDSAVEVVLSVLRLMMNTKGTVEGMEARLFEYLQDVRLMSVFALALGSSSNKAIAMVLDVLNLGYTLTHFPSTRLIDCIKKRNSRCNVAPPTSFKENLVFNIPPFPPAIEQADRTNNTSIKSITDRMERGLDIRDLRPTQLMEMYEHKISTIEMKEKYLQSLLDSKAAALQNADKLLAEYRCRWAFTDSEALRLRTLLQDAEHRSEGAKEETTRAVLNQQQVQLQLNICLRDVATLDKQVEEMKDTNASLEASIAAHKKKVKDIRAENNSAIEMISDLQKQLNECKQSEEATADELRKLESERKLLTKKLKEKESQLNDANKVAKKIENALCEAKDNIEAKQLEIANMKNDLIAMEQENDNQQQKIAAMESRCAECDKANANLQDSLKKLQNELCEKRAELAEQTRLTEGIRRLMSK